MMDRFETQDFVTAVYLTCCGLHPELRQVVRQGMLKLVHGDFVFPEVQRDVRVPVVGGVVCHPGDFSMRGGCPVFLRRWRRNSRRSLRMSSAITSSTLPVRLYFFWISPPEAMLPNKF